MKKIFLILLLFSFNSTNLHSLEADVFVQSTVNRASQILSKNISKEEKINQLKSIAKETVDIRGVGFYSLGSARKNLNDDQLSSYLSKIKTKTLTDYGVYQIEADGLELFEYVKGDKDSIMGLPIKEIVNYIKKLKE